MPLTAILSPVGRNSALCWFGPVILLGLACGDGGTMDQIEAQDYQSCLEDCVSDPNPMECDTKCKDSNKKSYEAWKRTVGEASGHPEAMDYQDCLERCTTESDPMACDNTCQEKHSASYKAWKEMVENP